MTVGGNNSILGPNRKKVLWAHLFIRLAILDLFRLYAKQRLSLFHFFSAKVPFNSLIIQANQDDLSGQNKKV